MRPRRGLRSTPVLSVRSPHQLIELRRYGPHLALHVGGEVRFHSFDAHRLCEALAVVPCLFRAPGEVREVLVLGGGDGLLAATLLRLDDVRRVTVCEPDPWLVEVAGRSPLCEWNEHSLASRRVRLALGSPESFLERSRERFDLIVCHPPAPKVAPHDRFYTPAFFEAARARLAPGGLFATSALFLPSTFSVIYHALRGAFPCVYPYRAPTITLGMAGFQIGAPEALRRRRAVPSFARYLTEGVAAGLFDLAKDERHFLAYSGAVSALDGYRVDAGLPPPFEEIDDDEDDEDEDDDDEDDDAE